MIKITSRGIKFAQIASAFRKIESIPGRNEKTAIFKQMMAEMNHN
jgi:hypothetical protein